MLGNYKFHLSIYSDSNGCGFYRIKSPDLSMTSTDKTFRLFSQQTPFRDMTVLPYLDTVRIQRWFGSVCYKYFMQELVPLSKKFGFKIIYDTDDILVYDDIPDYNVFKDLYFTDYDYLRDYLTNSDIITVSTEALNQYYANRYGLKNIIVINNYLPKWWYGNIYDENRSSFVYDKTKERPVICFCCGTSHFDSKNKNGGIDDFSVIDEWIINNRKKYLFRFQGGIPNNLMEYKDDFILEHGVDILSYPSARARMSNTLYVQPLLDSEFNRCKSNIKQLEAWAEGVPLITQNVSCYTEYDSYNTFSNHNELDTVINRLLKDKGRYIATIRSNYNEKLNTFWLEDNIDRWRKVLNGN